MIGAMLVVLLVGQLWLIYRGQRVVVFERETREHNVQVLRLLRNKLPHLGDSVGIDRATFSETIFSDREAAAWMEGQRPLDDPE